MAEALALALAFLTLFGAEHLVTTVDFLAEVELTQLTPVEVAIPAVVL